MRKTATAFFRLLRVRHYVKNLFIFTPLVFGLKLNDPKLGLQTVLTFIAFSLITSAVYIVNDICDRQFDSLHPQKKERPIASGIISVKQGIFFSIILFLTGIIPAMFVNLMVLYVILTYVVLNLLYSVTLKHIALLDIFIIALGFILRLYAGFSATHIELSHWLIIITFLLSLFLALGKRRDDILYSKENTVVRKAIKGYNLNFINLTMSIVSGIIILAYILYCITPDTITRFNSEHLYLTVFFVILGFFRYLQLIFVYNRVSDPVEILYTDRFLQISIMCWIAMFGFIAYS